MTGAILTIILTTLAPPDDVDKPDKPEPQHFCCTETWSDADHHYGTACDFIEADGVKACRHGGRAVLACSGSWLQNTSGAVVC